MASLWRLTRNPYAKRVHQTLDSVGVTLSILQVYTRPLETPEEPTPDALRLRYHVALAPNTLASVLVGFTVVCFGGLRLVRHNDEGFQSAGEKSYYRGTTVVHTNVVVIVNYLLVTFVTGWNGWLASVPILLSCPLMVSEYRAFKTVWGHVLVGAFGVAVGTLSVLLALGVL